MLDTLPMQIVIEILDLLSIPKDLVSMMLTCKTMHMLGSDQQRWEKATRDRYLILPDNEDWVHTFKSIWTLTRMFERRTIELNETI